MQSAIDEPVVLVAYDARWPELFEAERERLLGLFPRSLVAIEHTGSTAVPGLAAKPIIDILAGVERVDAADALMQPLCRSGYTTSAEFNATLTDRRWLMRAARGRRTHHLLLVVHGGAQWQARLAFRDALRADAALAERYLHLKRRLANESPRDREAYTEAKSEFVRAVVEGRGSE